MQTAFTAEKIFTGTEWITGSALLVSEGNIQSIVSLSSIKKDVVIKTYSNSFIAPAFIDVQLYGAYGKLLSVHSTTQTISLINDYCRKGGAALCVPTVATNTKEVFFKCIDAVKEYWSGGGKGVWGLHLEGPWLNSEKRGAHKKQWIDAPTIEEVSELLQRGKGVIKMITLAPEVCSNEVLKLIQSNGIIISAGHSNATFEQATNAFDFSVSAVTHLYNAMSPLQHRAPGLVGAAFLHNKVKASIIVDGHHVSFEAIKVAKRVMKDRLFVITDAVTQTSEGPYQHHFSGDYYTCNGTLSGSAATMFSSFCNLVKNVDIEVAEALRMCSLYPAQVLGCHHKYGNLTPGNVADFVVINNSLTNCEVLTG